VTLALWSILVAAILPLVATGIAKYGETGYDNNNPREWEAKLEGWRKRASWAHRNHIEAFGPFAAAVLVAHIAHGPQGLVDALAAAFIAARIAYTAAYIADAASLRSAMWALGFLAQVGLFCAGLFAAR